MTIDANWKASLDTYPGSVERANNANCEERTLSDLAIELAKLVDHYSDLLNQMLGAAAVDPIPSSGSGPGIRSDIENVGRDLRVNNMRLNDLAIRIGGQL